MKASERVYTCFDSPTTLGSTLEDILRVIACKLQRNLYFRFNKKIIR